jgi:hypothetical protein
VTYRGGDHFLQLALGFSELVFEVVSPVSEQDHRTRVVVVLDIDHAQTHNFVILGVRSILVVILWDASVGIYQAVESVRLSINQCSLNRNWLLLKYWILE